MHFRTTTLLASSLSLLAVANAETIEIDVGQDGLVFSPETVTAKKGDILSFHFYSTTGDHSVVSSTFEKPCVPNEGAFFSGYLGNTDGTDTFEVLVENTDPIWFYCSKGKHCQAGMVGVVNPPSDKTSSQYAAAAVAVAAASAPSAPTGAYTSGSSPSSTSPSSTSATSAATHSSTHAGSVTGSVASSVSSAASSASSVASSLTSSAAAATSSQPGVAGHNDVKAAGVLALVAGGLVALLA